MSLLYTILGTLKSAPVDGITSMANAATYTSDLRALVAERQQALGEAVFARRPRRRTSSMDIMSTRNAQTQNARFAADEATRLGFG